jgi:hypothetical protein
VAGSDGAAWLDGDAAEGFACDASITPVVSSASSVKQVGGRLTWADARNMRARFHLGWLDGPQDHCWLAAAAKTKISRRLTGQTLIICEARLHAHAEPPCTTEQHTGVPGIEPRPWQPVDWLGAFRNLSASGQQGRPRSGRAGPRRRPTRIGPLGAGHAAPRHLGAPIFSVEPTSVRDPAGPVGGEQLRLVSVGLGLVDEPDRLGGQAAGGELVAELVVGVSQPGPGVPRSQNTSCRDQKLKLISDGPGRVADGTVLITPTGCPYAGRTRSRRAPCGHLAACGSGDQPAAGRSAAAARSEPATRLTPSTAAAASSSRPGSTITSTPLFPQVIMLGVLRGL